MRPPPGPGDSRGGPLTTDRPTAENPGEKFRVNGTPIVRQTHERRAEPVNVWAHGYFTVGTRGRLALTMIVTGCVFCGRAHRHNGRPDFISGKRTASCGHGRYVVHLGTLEGCEAA